MRVPLNDLRALHAPLRDGLHAAALRVIDSGQYVLGPEVEGFERALAATAGRAFAVGVSSGSDALIAALMALGVGPGDEVVTTPLSFFATTEAIVRVGARPVFADVGDDLNLDVAEALTRVTPRTRAILAVDLFGRRARYAELAAAGVPLVEDAAQAIGHPQLGAGVAMAAISFFPTKNLGALGDGGAVLTDDAALHERVRLVRQHGNGPKYWHTVVGGNFRLDALQAALLSVKLPHLGAWNARRRTLALRYLAGLADCPNLIPPLDEEGHTFHQLVVRVRGGRRAALRAHLSSLGVDTEVYYPHALHVQPALLALGTGGRLGDHPRAEAAAEEVLALPLSPVHSDAQIDFVIDRVREFLS